jgi:predicted MPP superfamily phosphohydrolase
MNEIAQDLKLNSPSITLYAFHLRNSRNDGLEPTVAEAPQLWEQLVEFGNKLHIPELQNLQQQLVCYQDGKYSPQAEDRLGIKYFTLLRNQQDSLKFQLISQANSLKLEGLLCPFRLRDTYAIDLTLHSQDTFTLTQLSGFNFPDLLLPPQIQASLGQTLLLFGQPTEPQENYRDFASRCVEKILSERSSTELVGTGYLLGNPIFEYESPHVDPVHKLHILVWLKCQEMDEGEMDIVNERLLYLLWCRHKIQYVYHQSRWCDCQARQLYSRLEEYRRRCSQISQATNKQWHLRQLLAELRQMELEYTPYLGELEEHEQAIDINKQNYRNILEKLNSLRGSNLNLWESFLDLTHNKIHQIQIDISFLQSGYDRLQRQKSILQESLYPELVNTNMSGIPSEIYIRLRNALLDCDQFDNDRSLRNFFKIHIKLTHWQHRWQAGSPSMLVEDAIGYLNNKYYSDTSENVLFLLVSLLAESIDSEDNRHKILGELAEELNNMLSPDIPIRSNGASKSVNQNNRVNNAPQKSTETSKKIKKPSFNWLHLTDFHQGMNKQKELWPGVRDRLFKDLEILHKKCGPWDLVLFTGDLTQEGSAEDFQELDRKMDDLWKHFRKLGSEPKLLAVPGNHDLVRPDKDSSSVILLTEWQDRPKVQDEFWKKTGSEYRRVVISAFKNYTDWWERQPNKVENLTLGILPGDFSATVEKDGAKVGIVGLNTSFLQLTGGDYEGKLALDRIQFHQACNGDGINWAEQHNACLLLTHHPPGWLNQNSTNYLNEDITSHGRFAVHLCGHLHNVSSPEIVRDGVEVRRIHQARSLFGLEEYGDTKQEKRSHGYTAGRIEFSITRNKKGKLIFWPRKSVLQGGQREIIPDPDIKLTKEGCITREFNLLQPYVCSDTSSQNTQSVNLERPLLVICAQSLPQQAIGSDDIISGFNSEMKGRAKETVLLNFTNLVEGGIFTDPERAIQELTNPQGLLKSTIDRAGEADLVFHGLAHIPLLFLTGHLVSDRVHVRLFDFHPTSSNSNSWAWTDDGQHFPLLEVHGLPIEQRWQKKDVVLRISVSYLVSPDWTTIVAPSEAIEIDLKVPSPQRSIVRSEQQTREYGKVFRRILDTIKNNLSPGQKIHLFYAGPVALAFHLGQQISENIHPPIIVWNYKQGYDWGINLTEAYNPRQATIRPSITN